MAYMVIEHKKAVRRVAWFGRWIVLMVALASPGLVGPAGADTLYWGGGLADLPDGTPLPISNTGLSGVWNSSAQNWAADYDGASYGSYIPGSFAVLGFYTSAVDSAWATIIVPENLTLSGLMGSMQSGNSFRQGFILSNSAPTTITPTGGDFPVYINTRASDGTDAIQFRSNLVLSGSATLTKSGSGQLQLYGRNDAYSGAITIRGGRLTLIGGSDGVGALPLVQDYTVAGFANPNSDTYASAGFSTPTFTVTAISNGLNHQLHDQAVITLSRGRFEYVGRRNNNPASVSAETMRKIVLAPYGVLDIDGAGASGTSAGTLTLGDATAGLDRGPSGYGTLLVNVALGGSPTTDVIVANGFSTGALLPWIETSRAEFMQLNPTTKALETILSTAAPTDLSTWAAGSNYRLGNGGAFTPSGTLGNLSISSLGIYANNSFTLGIESGNTLTIASGGLGFQAAAGSQTATISGGSLASGIGQLYINAGDSTHSHQFIISSSIVGSGMDLIKSGIGEVRFSGSAANTYSGTTYVNHGHLVLNKTSGVSIPGDLVVEAGGSVNLGAFAGQVEQVEQQVDRHLRAIVANEVEHLLVPDFGQVLVAGRPRRFEDVVKRALGHRRLDQRAEAIVARRVRAAESRTGAAGEFVDQVALGRRIDPPVGQRGQHVIIA